MKVDILAGGTLATAPAGAVASLAENSAPEMPDYLRDVYRWAYLNPRNVKLLDREPVVKVILWGQHERLRRRAFAELAPGQRVLQPACFYGEFSPALARHLGLREAWRSSTWLLFR